MLSLGGTTKARWCGGPETAVKWKTPSAPPRCASTRTSTGPETVSKARIPADLDPGDRGAPPDGLRLHHERLRQHPPDGVGLGVSRDHDDLDRAGRRRL